MLAKFPKVKSDVDFWLLVWLMELFELFHSIQATVSNHEQCKHFQPFQKVKFYQCIPRGHYVTFYYVIFFRCCNHWAQRKLYFTNWSPEWCPASNYDWQCDWWNIGHSNQISRDQIGQTFQGQNWRWKCSVSCLITILALVQTSTAISFDPTVIRITWLCNRIQVGHMIFRGYLWFFF